VARLYRSNSYLNETISGEFRQKPELELLVDREERLPVAIGRLA